jgi:excisionase family DNA binding protein
MPGTTLAERIAALIEAEKPAETPAQAEPESRPLSYTFKGAARATGLGVTTLRREVRAGRLKKTKVRGRVLITDEELRRYLAENAEA